MVWRGAHIALRHILAAPIEPGGAPRGVPSRERLASVPLERGGLALSAPCLAVRGPASVVAGPPSRERLASVLAERCGLALSAPCAAGARGDARLVWRGAHIALRRAPLPPSAGDGVAVVAGSP